MFCVAPDRFVDANKFGTAYLQKLGWSAGTGLGSSGEGRTTHIKVDQKLDMLGIGAAHQKDPNGIAWKQNRDFENLLKRLNNTNESEEKEAETKVDGFVGAGKDLDAEVTKEAEEAKEVETGKSKKRKRTKDVKHVDDSGGGEKKKKKKKKDKVRDNEEVNDKEDEGAREGERDVSDSATEPTLVASVEPASTSTPQPARTPIIRHPYVMSISDQIP